MWLNILQQIRLCSINDGLGRVRPADEFASDGFRLNPTVLLLMQQWSGTDDRDLHNVIVVRDVNTVWFRDAAPMGNIPAAQIQAMPGYDDYGHEKINWSTISWARAVHINSLIKLTVEADTARARDFSRLSDVTLTHRDLQRRLADRVLLIEGDVARFPGAAIGGDPDAGSGTDDGEGTGYDGGGGGGGPINVPKVALFDFDAGFLAKAARFKDQFENDHLRYNFLVIAGDSKTGKSVFAEHGLGFRNPYVNEGGFYLNGFRFGEHDAIIFSDVPDIAKFVLKYKAVFQSNDKTTTVGESATNIYSIKVNTYKTPIVITMNKEADWDAMKNEPWIRDNSIVIDCGSQPMYKPSLDGLSEESQSQADANQACKDSWATVLE